MPETACPICGQVHSLPFPKEMVDIYNKYKNGNEDDKMGHASDLAYITAEFLDQHDPGFPDELHSLVDAYRMADLARDQASMNLARNIMRIIDSFHEGSQKPVDTN